MILQLLFLRISAVNACGRFFFVGDKNFALFGHVIKNLTTYGQKPCLLECLDTPQCISINKHENEAGKVTCELSKSSKEASPDDFKPRPGFVHLQTIALDQCTDDICHHKAALPDGWFQFGSKLYKYFAERKTWEQARQVCQANGGELVTIESERENQFVFEMFAKDKTNANDPDPYNVIAHWKLDGTDTDITLYNGAEYQEEDGQNHLYLNGDAAYATTPARNFRDGSFTLASWVKLLNPVNIKTAIYSSWSPGNGQFLFSASHVGKVSFIAVNSDGGFSPVLEASIPPVDTWFHAAAVWDRATNEVYLYVNGTKVGTEAVQAHWYVRDTNPALHDIGLKRDFGETLKGYLGDLMVFGDALSEDGIKRILDDYQKDRGVWIGLNDVMVTGSYKWSDNSDPVFTKWASGQPDHRYSNQYCVAIMDDDFGNWEDINCDHQLAFICQKNA